MLFEDIPVFIDSRADLYTKQFNGQEDDIFDDYEYINLNYQNMFQKYNITHVLLQKKDNDLYKNIQRESNFQKLYEDDYFVIYKRTNIS